MLRVLVALASAAIAAFVAWADSIDTTTPDDHVTRRSVFVLVFVVTFGLCMWV